MNLVKLTRITPKGEKTIFVNPNQVVFVEPWESDDAGKMTTLISHGEEGNIRVTESVADVVEKINKAMAVPVALVVPQPPSPGGLALPPGVRR